MDGRMNVCYYSADELKDMLRNALEYEECSREQILLALQALTGDEYEDDGTGDLLEMEG